MLLSAHQTSVLVLVQFNNFALTVGFYGVTCSYSSCLFLCALDKSWVDFYDYNNICNHTQR